jgi:hypothetical protein
VCIGKNRYDQFLTDLLLVPVGATPFFAFVIRDLLSLPLSSIGHFTLPPFPLPTGTA